MSGEHDWTRYPTDEMSLRLLIAACSINEATGQTHLHDFLDMGTVIESETLLSGDPDPDAGDAPVYFVEYAEGKAPHSPHSVIISLAEEILRLQQVADTRQPETKDAE